MEKSKLLALLQVIGEDDIDTINIDDAEITATVNDIEYNVFTEDEADEAFTDYQRDILSDLGLQSFAPWAQEHILENFIDVDWFEGAMKESYEGYVEDIKTEGNRLQEEMEAADVETEEDFVDYLCAQWSNGAEWYQSDFGEADFARVVQDNNLIDEDATIEWVKERDGRGCLASYDGEELEQDGYYIYRIS